MPECATGPLFSLVALETSDDAGGKLIPAHTKLPSCSGSSRCCGLEMSPRILTWARLILTGPARAGVSDEWAGTKPLRGIGGADHVSRSGRGILLRIRRAGGPPPCRAGQYRVRSNLSNSWPGRSRCPVRQAS